MQVRSSWGDGELQVGLLGRFNAHNLLATLATLLVLDMPFAEAMERVARTATVPGRMERWGGVGGQPLVGVDYAHTPHAVSYTHLGVYKRQGTGHDGTSHQRTGHRLSLIHI